MPEFGDRDLAFDVEYIGSACHSTMYSLRGFVTPWTREAQPSLLSQNDLARIPKISSDDALFNMDDICAPSNVPVRLYFLLALFFFLFIFDQAIINIVFVMG